MIEQTEWFISHFTEGGHLNEHLKNVLFIKALTKRIAIDSEEARSFAGKGVRKFHKRSPGWVGEIWDGEHDLNEECHVEEGGCQMEEVMEAYPDGQESQAVSSN